MDTKGKGNRKCLLGVALSCVLPPGASPALWNKAPTGAARQSLDLAMLPACLPRD